MMWHTLVCCRCLSDVDPSLWGSQSHQAGCHQGSLEGSLRIVASDSTASAWQWASMSCTSSLILSCSALSAARELVHHLDPD